MAQIPATRGNPHASEIAVQTALPLLGTASREDGQTVLTTTDSDLARLYEDKNILLTDGGTISWSGTALSFTSSLKLEVNSRTTGVAPVIIDLAATTRAFTADGAMLYAVIDRVAGTAIVTADVTTLPATVSANKELFIIAKRKGTNIILANGFSLSAGESSKLGQVGTVLDTNFAIGDSTDSTKKIAFDAAGTTGTSTTILSSQTTNKTQTLQDATDTFVYRNTTDVLANKELTFLRQSAATDAATTGTATTLGAFSTGIVRLTNVSLISLAGVPAGVSGQSLTIENKTGVVVGILNEDLAATAANRILTGTNGTVSMQNNATFVFTYDDISSRWMLTGGSGSGSGSGGVNFIPNGNAETDNPFINYVYTAGTRPVASTGGPGTSFLTTSITNTTPLDGNASFLITQTNATNQQGQAEDIPFLVAPAYRGKVVTIDFDHILLSGTFQFGTATQDSDLIVYIIDVDNNIAIEPSNFKFLSNSTTLATRFSASFQTSTNSLNYRLSFYKATSAASLFSMKIDNISISPSKYVYGTPVTDWQLYVPTFTGVPGGASEGFYWRRNGDSVEIRGSLTTGTPDGTSFSFTLPNGIRADPAKQGSQSASNSVGHVYSLRGSANESFASITGGPFVAFTDTSVNGNLVYTAQDSTSSLYTKDAGNELFITGARATIEGILIPIVGWSSSVQMSDQTDTRVVALRVQGDPASAGTNTPVIYPTVVFDTHGSYDNTTGTYTVPVSGIYRISGATPGGGGGGGAFVQLYKNGSLDSVVGIANGNGGITFSGTVSCVTGDLLTIRPNTTLDFQANSTWMLDRISGPSAIAASENVNASFYLSANQALTANTTRVNFDTKIYDSHNAVTTGVNWVFTAPTTGKYEIAVNGQVAASGSLYLVKTGVNPYRKYLAGFLAGLTVNGSATDVELNQGETIHFLSDNSFTIIGTAPANINSGPGISSHVSIKKVG